MKNFRVPPSLTALSCLCLSGSLISPAQAAFEADDPFAVIGGKQNQINLWMAFTDVENSFYHHLMKQAEVLLDERAAKVSRISTVAEVKERQQWFRQTFEDLVGPLPEKTPLNARVTGVIEGPGYRVEKVIYESLPGFPVTAALYIPNNLEGKAPAVLFCAGHAWNGFRAGIYQQAILDMVDKGMIVLAFDPLGQGERLQYYDPQTDESRIAYDDTCSEHSFVGAQCFISDAPLARYFIHDGMRSIDYLLSRPEVDPTRIGCTGNSGGGVQTAYLAAIDERITAAAPSCFITTLKRLFQSIGPQDAEQNWPSDIVAGLDHGDFLIARAPLPILLVTTSNDFFSIQGARETYAEAKRIYEILGAPEALQTVEDTSTHGYTTANSLAIARFFQEQFKLPDQSHVSDRSLMTDKELQVTATGQVSTALDALGVFDVQLAEARKLVERLQQARRTNLQTHLQNVLRDARRLSGYQAPQQTPEDPMYMGRAHYDGYTLTKHVMQGEGDYLLPYFLFVPDNNPHADVVLYLDADGKAAQAGPGGRIESIVRQGYAVLAPDLLGKGELGPGDFRGDSYYYRPGNVSYNMKFAALRFGRILPGIHASDISRLVSQIRNTPQFAKATITAVATKELAPALAHAAAFDQRIDNIALIGGLGSFESIATNQYYVPHLYMQTVSAALTAYDLPDLQATLAPRRLLILDQVNHHNKPGAYTQDAPILEILHRAYKDQTNKLTIANSTHTTPQLTHLLNWLKQH